MAKAKSQKSLSQWTKQDWRTKSGKPSTQGSGATGERYLPAGAIKAMDSDTYAKSSAKKRKDTKAGKLTFTRIEEDTKEKRQESTKR